MSTFEPSGVWPAMLTPLADDGQPDLAAVDQLVELFAAQGLGGLFLLGSTGQGVLLSPDERRAVAERAVQAAAGRIPVMIHVGSVATSEAVALAQHAASCGADAVSSVPPIYYRTDAAGTFAHYARIGAATDLPFFPYHAMFLATALPPAPEYVSRLLEVPNIAGMKFTDHNLYLLGLINDLAGGALHILSGADELICHAALSGAVGAIGTFYNEWGEVASRARSAMIAGDFTTARRFMSAFQQAIDVVLRSGGVWTFHRAAMRLKFGIEIGPVREPLGMNERPWQDAEVERLLAQVDAAA